MPARQPLVPSGRDSAALIWYDMRERSLPADVRIGLSAGFFVFWGLIELGQEGNAHGYGLPSGSEGPWILDCSSHLDLRLGRVPVWPY